MAHPFEDARNSTGLAPADRRRSALYAVRNHGPLVTGITHGTSTMLGTVNTTGSLLDVQGQTIQQSGSVWGTASADNDPDTTSNASNSPFWEAARKAREAQGDDHKQKCGAGRPSLRGNGRGEHHRKQEGDDRRRRDASVGRDPLHREGR